jgi:molybdenum cofactor biosynthesis enzyme MoaA
MGVNNKAKWQDWNFKGAEEFDTLKDAMASCYTPIEPRNHDETNGTMVITPAETTTPEAPTTANNRQVIESIRLPIDGWLVLCVGWNDVTPYVSWIVYDTGSIECGQYVRTIHDASTMWRERCQKWGI